jgi:hypothetical protein
MSDSEGKRRARAQGRSTLFLAAAAALAWACSKDPPQPATGSMDAAGDSAGVDHLVDASDGRLDSRPDIPPDTQPTPPANVVFPDPPQLTCSRVSDCEFPPSTCADPSCDGGVCPGYPWVVYYDNPQCNAGKCVFEQRYFECGGWEVCSGGGCRFNGTAAP